MSIIKEFREFAVKGNVVDLAVGLIIGVAFGKIVSSLVTDVLMPPIGMLLGNVDFSNLKFLLREKTAAAPEVAIRYGVFINTVIDFLIVALAVFLVVKQINRLKRKEAVAPSDPTTKNCPYCQTAIPLAATRCPNCTSELKAA